MNTKIICSVLCCLLCANSSFGQPPKGRVIFSSRQDDNDAQLFSINANGTGERQITTSGNNDLPSVHHNRVVYRQTQNKKSQRASLFITGISGGQPKAIMENKVVCYPRWSLDGRSIAYEYYENKNSEIWVMDTTGNNSRKLVSDAQHPSWCHDNKTMLFTRAYEIWSLDLVKGTERKLTNLSAQGLHAKWPALSPDGSKIAFLGFDSARQGIFVMGSNGENLKFFERCDDAPCWTNSSNYIVCSFLNMETNHGETVMINVATGEKRFITHNNRDNYEPVWVE